MINAINLNYTSLKLCENRDFEAGYFLALYITKHMVNNVKIISRKFQKTIDKKWKN